MNNLKIETLQLNKTLDQEAMLDIMGAGFITSIAGHLSRTARSAYRQGRRIGRDRNVRKIVRGTRSIAQGVWGIIW